MTRLALLPADQVPLPDLHAAFGAAFADYVAGPFVLAADQFPVFLARQVVDLAASRVALAPDGGIAAFAFVARRERAGRWRLATMGARPEARGRGAAPALLDELIARQPALELEVFAQNPRAVRLYESRGFAIRRPLFGWQRAPGPVAGAPAPVREVDRSTAFAWLDAADAAIPELPLQLTAASLAGQPVPLTAWQRGTAQLVFSLAGTEAVVVQSLVDPDPAQTDAEALVKALLHAHPLRTLRCGQLQRDDLGGAALRRLGAAPLPLHQWWMLRASSAA
jgi:ribosomal protein S18 acetylase RimI-like enzyme